MKVLLVKPFNIGDHIQPSLGLGYLASAIRNRHQVEILDCIKRGIKTADFEKHLSGSKFDVIGFQCYTFDIHNLKSMVTAAKNSGAVTVMGGPQPSVLPFDTMEYFGLDLDYCFVGEAEIGFKTLLDHLSEHSSLEKSEISGLVWRKAGNVVVNDRMLVNDLDSMGMPAWDLIKPQEYPEAQHGAFFRKFPIAPIMVTRGCPFKCTFCAGNLISGHKIRSRSAENVLAEMELLYKDFGIREFHIIDDNFTFDKAFAKSFLRKLKEKKMDISWAVPNGVRMDTLDEELLTLMKETGLYLVSLGIESGSDRVLKLMRKGITTAIVEKAVKMIRKAGIEVAGFFILGYPGETATEMKQTIMFSLKLDLLRANYFTYLPFPGTESYDTIKREEGLEKVNWKKFYFTSASYAPRGITATELKALQRKAFMDFYLRPSIFIKNLAQVKSFNHFKFLFKRFVHWIISK